LPYFDRPGRKSPVVLKPAGALAYADQQPCRQVPITVNANSTFCNHYSQVAKCSVRENFAAQTNQWFYFDVVLANMAFLFRIADFGMRIFSVQDLSESNPHSEIRNPK